MILHLTTALEASGSTVDGWRTPLLAVPAYPDAARAHGGQDRFDITRMEGIDA
jgi:hypothetical protein